MKSSLFVKEMSWVWVILMTPSLSEDIGVWYAHTFFLNLQIILAKYIPVYQNLKLVQTNCAL